MHKHTTQLNERNIVDLRDGRTVNRVYPWHELLKAGDSFEWDNIHDAQKIRSASAYRKFKVSVRTEGNNLLVVRVD